VCAASLLVATLAPGAHGLKPLNDDEMAGVAGRDGLAVQLESESGVSAQEAVLSNDPGGPGAGSAVWRGLEMLGLGSEPLFAEASLDVGSDGSEAMVLMEGSWDDRLAYIDQWRLGDGQGANRSDSIGSLGVRTQGSLTLGNTGGFFNASGSEGRLGLSSDGAMYYRQGAKTEPELSFQNFSLDASFIDSAGDPGTGTVGIDDSGVFLDADFMDLALFFDLAYAESPNPDTNGNGYFDPGAAERMILFGWEGGINNASLRLDAGGIGTGTYTQDGQEFFDYNGAQTGNRSEGLNISAQWDYSPDFAWRLGQASDTTEVELQFTDWQRLGGTSSPESHDFNLSMILDTVTENHTPGGICFGGDLPTSGSLVQSSCTNVGGVLEEIPIPAGERAFSVTMRDGGLHAYNTNVNVIDGDTTDTFDWSLLYTFGKLDGNFHFYPGGKTAGTPGLKSDVVLGIQSPGYWQAAQDNFAGYETDPNEPGWSDNPASRWASNTHFMIADTATSVDIDGDGASGDQFGIGILNADLLWKVEDLFLRLVEDSEISVGDASVPDMPGGFALESQTGAQYRFRGLLGGGDLLNLDQPARIALLDVNLDTDQFVFVLGPASDPADEYISFDGLLDFNGSAYLSFAEPSRPGADISLNTVSGRVRWQDGRVELVSSATTGDRPELTIANDLIIGNTAGGDPLQGTLSLGEDDLGQMAIPTGQFYSSITLKPQ
jgi:hypothetical protein